MTGPAAPAAPARQHGSRRRRSAAGLLLSVLVALVAPVVTAGPASAHNVLIGSDPADGSTVEGPPKSISLTFDQPVQDFQTVVVVTGPDGQTVATQPPVVDSTVVTTEVGTLPAPGQYTAAYRVVSADGHPVQGEVRFTFVEPAVPPSVPPSSEAPAGSSTPATSSASSPASSSAGSAAPTAATSSGAVPTSAVPTSAVPTSAVPTSAVPTSAVPTSAVPTSAVPTSATAPTTAVVAPATDSGSGMPAWVWIVIAVVVVAAVAGGALLLRRSRTGR